MIRKYHNYQVNDLASELFKASGDFGEDFSDVMIKVCKSYLLSHRDINGSFDGLGKKIIDKIESKYKGGSQWLNTK